MNTYVIQQNVISSHSNGVSLTRYLCEKNSDKILFSEDIDDAIQYDSVDEAKEVLRKVFMRLAYHVTIQYEIVKLD